MSPASWDQGAPPRHARRRCADAHHGIPVTTTLVTLVDLAARLARDPLEAAINEADKLDLIDPEELRAGLDELPRRSGIAHLRTVLDRRTFSLTDSQLERRFLPLVRAIVVFSPHRMTRIPHPGSA